MHDYTADGAGRVRAVNFIVATQNNYDAMQKLQKVVAMEGAGAYAKMAQEKLDEIKKNWRKRVK